MAGPVGLRAMRVAAGGDAGDGLRALPADVRALADVPDVLTRAAVQDRGLVESELSQTLRAALDDPEEVAAMREEPDGGAKYARKMRFLSGFARHLTRTRRRCAAQGREFLVMGDFNIAHDRLDIKNWRANQKSEGFLPEERAWLDQVLTPRTLVDVVRRLHPDTEGPYSWWSWMGQAFTKDAGWRIDYQFATPGLARLARCGGTDRADSYEQRMSDHAPVVVDYDF